jgi:hypothetical protein
MESFKKISLTTLAVMACALGTFGFNQLNIAQAATSPSLGLADGYAVLASTYTNTSAGTTINGSIGFTTGPAVAPLGTQVNYGSSAPYSTAGSDQGSALSNLNSQSCTFSFAAGAINLSTDTTHGAIGVYMPGVYCIDGAMNVSGPLTLSGDGTYIFRSTGALTSTAGATITLNGASTCDVFWTPSAATTLAANTTFKGTVISNAGITIGANTNWVGRALSFGGTTTSDMDTLTAPICITAPIPTSIITPAPVIATTTTPTTTVTAIVVAPVIATATPILTAASVTSPVPDLPSAGIVPEGANTPWNIIIAFGSLAVALSSLVLVLKKGK